MRVTIDLELQEKAALTELAQRERRDPRDQAALIIRETLINCGLLKADPIMPISTQPAQNNPQAVRHVTG